MDNVIVGLFTLGGVLLALGVTRAGLQLIIHLIPTRDRGPSPSSEQAS